jgi:hypothetical protein
MTYPPADQPPSQPQPDQPDGQQQPGYFSPQQPFGPTQGAGDPQWGTYGQQPPTQQFGQPQQFGQQQQQGFGQQGFGQQQFGQPQQGFGQQGFGQQQWGFNQQQPFGQPQFGYGPMYQPPRRRTGRIVGIVIGSIVAILVILGAIGAALGGSPSSSANSGGHSGKAPTAPGTTLPATSAAPPGPANGTVIATLKGSGTGHTATFTVPAAWTLKWSYSCKSFFGGKGNFAVFEDGGRDLNFKPINQIGKGGHGVKQVSGDAGTHYLSVASECKWTMQVIAGQ